MIGDGPDRAALEKQIAALDLSGHVTLLGNQPNPFPYMDKMDGFVLTSRYEGQGMVIWEAKALGLPLYISKNLEAYNPGITGCSDMVQALIHAQSLHRRPMTIYRYTTPRFLRASAPFWDFDSRPL